MGGSSRWGSSVTFELYIDVETPDESLVFIRAHPGTDANMCLCTSMYVCGIKLHIL